MNPNIIGRERKARLKRHLQILIQLAKIDRNYDQREKMFIREIGKRFQFDHNEIMNMERNPGYIGNLNSTTLEEKIELIYDAIQIVKIDEKILPNEIVLCQEIADRLGFKRSVIEILIPMVDHTQSNGINIPAIRRKIAPYL